MRRLLVRDFRNLASVDIEPAPRFNLIYGDNGHGKTSLIEALYVLSTTKSFRSQKLTEVIAQGAPYAGLRGEIESFGLKRDLRAQLSPRGRSFLVDGKRPKRNLDYALKAPVIAFHPGDLTLASGPATSRRTLLDRVLLHQDPAGSDARISYQKALRDRQKLLTEKGVRAVELDAYEQVCATHGARMARGRAHAAQTVLEALTPSFAEMAAPGLVCQAVYEPGGTPDVGQFSKQLAERRHKDLYRGAATFGPQRDEISFSIEGRPARTHASQGQQRLLTLAMKMAELACVREVTGVEPMLLLDDVSSELDPARTHAVFELLRHSASQIFVTTTRPELFSEVSLRGDARADFRVENGVVEKSPI